MEKILVIAGQSAVGKTTVVGRILEKDGRFEYIRSATTRAPRADAFNSEYIYLSKEEFEKRILGGCMLEYTEYGGNFYGTPKSEIERIFSAGKIPLLILDLNGVEALKRSHYDFSVFAVYITADRDIIEKRLLERVRASGMTKEAMDVFEKRKLQNAKDLERLEKIREIFDFTSENKDIEECAESITAAFFASL